MECSFFLSSSSKTKVKNDTLIFFQHSLLTKKHAWLILRRTVKDSLRFFLLLFVSLFFVGQASASLSSADSRLVLRASWTDHYTWEEAGQKYVFQRTDFLFKLLSQDTEGSRLLHQEIVKNEAEKPFRSMKINGSGDVSFAKEGEANAVTVKGAFSGDKKNISVYFSETYKNNLLAKSLQSIIAKKEKIKVEWPFETGSSNYECTAVVEEQTKNLVCTINYTGEEKTDKVQETLAKDSFLRQFI